MSAGYEANLTLYVPAQALAREATFFSIWAQDGGAGIELSLLCDRRARLCAWADGAPFIETTTTSPLPLNRVCVLALVVSGGDVSTKARIHVDDFVAAKVRRDTPAAPFLQRLEHHVVQINRGQAAAPGIRLGLVEFVVASKELSAVQRSDALAYYRESAERVGLLTWFEPDDFGRQIVGAESLKLTPGVQVVPIPPSPVHG